MCNYLHDVMPARKWSHFNDKCRMLVLVRRCSKAYVHQHVLDWYPGKGPLKCHIYQGPTS